MTVRGDGPVAGSERKTSALGQDNSELIEEAASEDPQHRPRRDVTVVEVGPRDGLQNETVSIPTSAKIAFVDALTDAGLPVIEATSFVNPKAVPQLADAAQVLAGIRRDAGTRYPVLVPNQRGFERAVDAGADAVALFTAATEAFCRANVGASVDGTFERFAQIMPSALKRGLWVRGYVSVSFGCPYVGPVDVRAVIRVAERLLQIGCHEICLADTIGVATPVSVIETLLATRQSVSCEQLALHFHDTAGTALANVKAALQLGVRTFDSAVGGLGGCPFAPGAPGNLSTERLIGCMEGLGLRTGADSTALGAALDLVRPHLPGLGRQHP